MASKTGLSVVSTSVGRCDGTACARCGPCNCGGVRGVRVAGADRLTDYYASSYSHGAQSCEVAFARLGAGKFAVKDFGIPAVECVCGGVSVIRPHIDAYDGHQTVTGINIPRYYQEDGGDRPATDSTGVLACDCVGDVYPLRSFSAIAHLDCVTATLGDGRRIVFRHYCGICCTFLDATWVDAGAPVDPAELDDLFWA